MHRRRLALHLIVLCLAMILSAAVARADAITPQAARRLVDQAWRIARDRFCDRRMKGVDWNAERERALRAVATARTRADCHAVINAMLDRLHTSHTHLYGPDDPFYPYLVSTFRETIPRTLLRKGAYEVEDIGLFPFVDQEGVFVGSLLDGGPAGEAGLKVGDRILRVGGRPWRGLAGWRGRAGQKVAVEVQRVRGGPVLKFLVVPRRWDPQAALAEATRRSARVVRRGSKRLGYVHAWAFTNDEVQKIIFNLLAGRFRDCDGVVLDLRDGLGGGGPDFMLPWLGYPSLRGRRRDGKEVVFTPPGPRETVVLINGGTRSGKELYAYAFKTSKRALLMGTRTAGAVTGGSPFYLEDGSLLYLAVMDISFDSVTLEGHGVAPDVEVARDVPWSGGADPQLETALDRLAAVPSLQGIDVFGSHRLSVADARKRFGARLARMAYAQAHGDALLAARLRREVEDDLHAMGGFAYAKVSVITYFPPQAGQYVTIDLVDDADAARRMAFRAAPHGTYADPDGLLAAWSEYLKKGLALLRSGKMSATTPQLLHPYHTVFGFEHPDLAPYRAIFDAGAKAHQAELERILADDENADHRALAAYALAHVKDGNALVRALVPAIWDPAEEVRNNAMRVLSQVADKHPDIDVPVEPVLAALEYPATTDRNKAAAIVYALAKRPRCRAAIIGRGAALMALLQLEQPNNHSWAYAILRELSGESYGERDYTAWWKWLRAHGTPIPPEGGGSAGSGR
jgi:carboxyl-terminal processing protease